MTCRTGYTITDMWELELDCGHRCFCHFWNNTKIVEDTPPSLKKKKKRKKTKVDRKKNKVKEKKYNNNFWAEFVQRVGKCDSDRKQWFRSWKRKCVVIHSFTKCRRNADLNGSLFYFIFLLSLSWRKWGEMNGRRFNNHVLRMCDGNLLLPKNGHLWSKRKQRLLHDGIEYSENDWSWKEKSVAFEEAK